LLIFLFGNFGSVSFLLFLLISLSILSKKITSSFNFLAEIGVVLTLDIKVANGFKSFPKE
jgi:hypothetical protein